MNQESPRITHRILGIDFFDGSARAAIDLLHNGGLLVVPAAPALKDLDCNPEYREALLNADLVLTDEGVAAHQGRRSNDPSPHRGPRV